MTTNLLQLNSKKPELMVIARNPVLQKVVELFHLLIYSCSNTSSHEIRNLGVILDSTLSYQSHIKSITRSAFYHLRNISHLRPSLSYSVAETLIHNFIFSSPDYCNGVLSGIPSYNTVCVKLSCQDSYTHLVLAADR